MARWGKAGVRLTPAEIPRRDAAIRARRAASAARDAADLEAAHQAWREGRVIPASITVALDMHGLEGPQVDEQCGAREPDVDRWEAGDLYPTWEQLQRLAELCGVTPRFFTRSHGTLDPRATSLRFHLAAGDDPPREPVLFYPRHVVEKTVGPANAAVKPPRPTRSAAGAVAATTTRRAPPAPAADRTATATSGASAHHGGPATATTTKGGDADARPERHPHVRRTRRDRRGPDPPRAGRCGQSPEGARPLKTPHLASGHVALPDPLAVALLVLVPLTVLLAVSVVVLVRHSRSADHQSRASHGPRYAPHSAQLAGRWAVSRFGDDLLDDNGVRLTTDPDPPPWRPPLPPVRTPDPKGR